MGITASIGMARRLMLLVWLAGLVGTGDLLAADDLRLVEAVRHEDAETVRALLDQQVDVNTPQPDGATALHWAAYLDDLETAVLLLEAGANANATNDYGVTPLWLACTNAAGAMVEQLVSAGANPNAALSESGATVLMNCARTGNADTVRTLSAHGADVNAKESSLEQTALMWAVSQRHPAVVEVLLEHGADVTARSRVTREVISRALQGDLQYGLRLRMYGSDAEETQRGGFTPLLFASRTGDVESARLLLKTGADVNDTAADRTSPLVMATYSGQGAIAEFLLENGANPNAAGAGYTALHTAVLTGNLDVVKALLAHGARPDAQITQGTRVTRNGQALEFGEHWLGATPFCLAAKFAETEMLRVLAANGADTQLAMRNGWTPLMVAAGAGWRHGRWDRRDRSSITDLATQVEMYDEHGTLEAVKLTVELGADVNAVDEEGSTALHAVVDKGFDTVVKFLVDQGANLHAKNRRGQTPLDRLLGRRPGEDAPQAALNSVRQATADLLLRLGAEE